MPPPHTYTHTLTHTLTHTHTLSLSHTHTSTHKHTHTRNNINNKCAEHEQRVDLASVENKIVKRLRHLALRKLAEDAARLDARRARRMSLCKLREEAENVDDQLRRGRRAAANKGVQLILECSALAFRVDENVAGGSSRRGRGASRASAE